MLRMQKRQKAIYMMTEKWLLFLQQLNTLMKAICELLHSLALMKQWESYHFPIEFLFLHFSF